MEFSCGEKVVMSNYVCKLSQRVMRKWQMVKGTTMPMHLHQPSAQTDHDQFEQ